MDEKTKSPRFYIHLPLDLTLIHFIPRIAEIPGHTGFPSPALINAQLLYLSF